MESVSRFRGVGRFRRDFTIVDLLIVVCDYRPSEVRDGLSGMVCIP